MSVHYKFKSALEYDTITFDGLHISVNDLKNAILQQKRIGKSTDFDLQVTNAQTKEVYTDENALIAKNTSLLIARIPTVAQNKPKQWEGYGGDSTPPQKSDDGGPIAKAADLSSLDAPEDDKIKAMMSQSTQDYDPSNYQKIRGANQVGAVPPSYRCYKCHQSGHWIKDCTYGQGTEQAVEIKKSTGIPQSFMVPVDGPQVPGAMITPNGSYAVPVLDHQAYNYKPQPLTQIDEKQPDIPEDLICSICSDLLTDAVMIPCCGNSFCDECIRFALLESEDHECPDCHEKDNSPATLIPNRFLRKSVANFKNTTGYIKKTIFRPPLREQPIKEKEKPVEKLAEEKTVISEADSTDQTKSKAAEKELVEQNESGKSASETEPIAEGPPGVSPMDSPSKMSKIKRISSNRGETAIRRHRSRDVSPKPRNSIKDSPSYNINDRNEDRPGTPTVDEPGMSANNYQYTNPPPPSNLGGVVPTMPPMQGPPPIAFPPAQPAPPFGGPPPNFRLPPPGSAPPYMPPGPYNPPRPMFDPRPNMSGPPPMYAGFPPGPRPSHREYDRRIRNRTPPGVIDDPLAAFNRMIREKDERERRAKQRMQRRNSYSRSRSRSRSYSPRSPRRMRSRSPRRRSRSRSFSISRSRSRSYSGSLRGGSPGTYRDNRDRDYSPRHSPRSRGGPPPRYRSPVRPSPPRRYKEPADRGRDIDDYDRKEYRDHPRDHRDYRGHSRDRPYRHGDDRHYFADGYEDRNPVGRKPYGMRQQGPPPEAYYNPPPPEITQSYQPLPATNRYSSRDYPPFEAHAIPPIRKYEDVAPPGVEEPPIPGLDTPKLEDRYDKESNKVDNKDKTEDKVVHKDEKRREKDKIKDHDTKKDKSKESDKRKRYRRSKSRSLTPRKRSKSRESVDKRRKKRDESSDREKSDKERKREHSDDDRSKKSKDKKRRKEKEREKKEEKKKRKEKKDKHKKDEKDKKYKENKPEKTSPEREETKVEPPAQSPPIKNEEKDKIEKQVLELYSNDLPKPTNDYTEKKEINPEPHHTPEPIKNPSPKLTPDEKQEMEVEKGELDRSKVFDESEERDILELHLNDSDLKAELDVKNEMLAPLPEKSKWEFDEDGFLLQNSPKDSKKDMLDKNGKVTKEVLKKAENAIFAKAINAIRPIEIKKISSERAKLYSGEKEGLGTESSEAKTSPVRVALSTEERKKTDQPSVTAPPQKLSVKERLGIKVNEPDKVIKIDERLSPFSRRVGERNYGLGERRIEIEMRKKDDRRDNRRDTKDRDNRSRHRESSHRHKDKKRSRSRGRTKEHERRKRSRSRSESEDRKRARKDRKRREKDKETKEPKKKEKDEKEKETKDLTKLIVDKRKPTIDESNFEPDYDLESETESKRDSSSSESSSSSSEEERKRKKHKKHRKKKYRKDSSSSSSESDSDSSDSERDKKKKKHKKKKKKSKHK